MILPTIPIATSFWLGFIAGVGTALVWIGLRDLGVWIVTTIFTQARVKKKTSI